MAKIIEKTQKTRVNHSTVKCMYMRYTLSDQKIDLKESAIKVPSK